MNLDQILNGNDLKEELISRQRLPADLSCGSNNTVTPSRQADIDFQVQKSIFNTGPLKNDPHQDFMPQEDIVSSAYLSQNASQEERDEDEDEDLKN